MEICKKNVFFIYLGVLMLSSQVSIFSSASDTISTNQPLSGFRTIVSSHDTFELGFFDSDPKGIRKVYYIGMWYKKVSTQPINIVWVANREYPIASGFSSYTLSISNGNLILCDYYTCEEPIWSTGVNSSSSKDVQAVLLDNGNLVLRDGPTSSAAVLWQSFDHPSHTWLPGAKLKLGSPLPTSWKSSTDPSPGPYSLQFDPKTQSLVTVWNGSKSYWSSGPWDDRLETFKGFPGTDLIFNLNLDESYVTYSVSSNSTYRLVMDVSGQLMQYKRDDNTLEWSMIESAPRDRCEVYNYCGSFGICSKYKSQKDPCRCVPGFRKKSLVEETYLNTIQGGCIKKIKLECGKGNSTFLAFKNMKLDTDPTTSVLTTIFGATCASACLSNCFCEAYTYDGNKCLMWTTNAFNLQQLDANQGYTFFLKVAASNTSTATSNIAPAASNISTATSNKRKSKDPKVRRIVLPVVLSSLLAAAAIFFSVGLYCCISSRIRTKRTQTDEKQSRELLEGDIIDDDGEQICHLNLRDIMAATNAFSEENKLGEGGFGPVYKGNLPNGMDVAIKRLSKNSSQGLTEFRNEVVLIIKLQHKNLVRLLGYCVEGDEKLLIYEYMPNKSLDVLLFGFLVANKSMIAPKESSGHLAICHRNMH